MNRVDRAPGVRLVTDSPHTRVAPPEPPSIEPFDFDRDDDRPDLVALCGRRNAGLSVQLLTNRGDEPRAWITLDVNGQTETFEVEPRDALDAYHHPYAYGATLPL
jgi:hypothetical protein